jgi:hypothetical protein
MFETLGDHAEGRCLYARDRFVAIPAVAQHARQRSHLGDPSAVVFTFKFDRERHASNVRSPRLSNKSRSALRRGARTGSEPCNL